MALSADTQIELEIGSFNDLPVEAAATIYAGSMCSLTEDGYADVLTAGEPFVGHAYSGVDNSAGAAAAETVNLHSGIYRAEVALVVNYEDIGLPVYASDDATVTLDPGSATGPYTLVGHVIRRASATRAVVEFSTLPEAGGQIQPQNTAVFFDDFIGYQAMTSETGSTGPWLTVDVGDATEALVADADNGQFALILAATDEAEDAVLYMGDQLNFDIGKLKTMEFRAQAVTPGTGVAVVAGMAGDHNLDKDTVAQNAWFKWPAGLAVVAETDDGTTDNDDKAVATQVTATWYDYKIDFTDTADVKFYVNGTQVATATTFDMSAYTGNLQPYFSADKASGTGTASLIIDYVRIVSAR